MNGNVTLNGTLSGTLVSSSDGLSGTLSGGSMNGTLTVPASLASNKDYEKLKNKPQIETVELVGNKSFEDLGLQPIENTELMELLTL